MVFVTFFGCCFSLALLAAALGTRYWFVSSCRQRINPIANSISQVNRKTLPSNTTEVVYTEDEDGDSAYRPNSTGFINFGLFQGDKGLNVGFGERISQFEVSGTDGLMSQSLWAGTIACLSLGLLFAVLGAVFAVVNTATTPVEAITGIPGLYIWNGLAALFELVAVICWAVQFSSNLTHNVLIVDSLGGWTTEGGEALGYSFWLVVVAVVVHCANCALIGFGTYEPKVKEKLQEPDKANNDILLY